MDSFEPISNSSRLISFAWIDLGTILSSHRGISGLLETLSARAAASSFFSGSLP
jgi:hypothetical protein